MAKGDDILERLMNFAALIINPCAQLPNTSPGKHIAGQLLPCGISPTPNYGEVRGAESTKDFLHKLGVVFKVIK